MPSRDLSRSNLSRACLILSSSGIWASASLYPLSMSVSIAALSKLSEPYPLMSGTISTSHSSECSTWASLVDMLRNCCMICGRERVLSASKLPLSLTSTPMMMSAPISLHTSVGKLFRKPPSIKIIFPIFTGANTPGMAIEALIAVGRCPLWNTISLLVIRSTATQAKGMGRVEKSMESWYPTLRPLNRLSTFWPFMTPAGRLVVKSAMPVPLFSLWLSRSSSRPRPVLKGMSRRYLILLSFLWVDSSLRLTVLLI